MIGKEERSSDGSYSSSSSSSSAAGPESLQGSGCRTSDTRPVSLLKPNLIFTLCSMVVMTLHMNVSECVPFPIAHMVGVRSQEFLPHKGHYGVLNVYILCTLCSHFFFVPTFLLLTGLCFFFPSPQLFVIVVWNFELYMIPLALLLPLAWNYILIASGKDTRQDVVSRPHSFFSFSPRKAFAWQLRHHCFMSVLLVL